MNDPKSPSTERMTVAMGLSRDPSLDWSSTCDQLRTQITGLPKQAGVFLYPSLEAAALEAATLLADREREVSGVRNTIVYGLAQDPTLDGMAKALSGTGLDVRPKTWPELQDTATWFAELKPKTLIAAFAEDDRFTGAVYDSTAIRATLLADGVRLPVLTLNSGSVDWRSTLPRPFEIRLNEIALGGGTFVTLAVVGERLRLEPRFAPLMLDRAHLAKIANALASAKTSDASTSREEIENFEAMLPDPFKPWWPKGASRQLDRAIFTSGEHDGSWVIDQIREPLILAIVAQGVSKPEAIAKVEAGLFSLSGCLMNDERRQEWLRGRGEDAWRIRGAVHISGNLIKYLAPATLQGAIQR